MTSLDPDTIAFAGRCFDMARRGHAAELAELVDQGVPANLTNDKGDTLLILAAYHGHADTVRELLARGADAERFNDRGQTALGAACFKGFRDVAHGLLARGALVDGCGPDGRTPLMVAAMFDRLEMVEMLLAAGADPVRRDAAGLTAADSARRMGAQGTPGRLDGAMAAS